VTAIHYANVHRIVGENMPRVPVWQPWSTRMAVTTILSTTSGSDFEPSKPRPISAVMHHPAMTAAETPAQADHHHSSLTLAC
jgi:hypothetical protein